MQSACQDTPKRPSARVEDGHFVLTVNGNRGNWAAITQAAGVPANATTTIDGDTMIVRWPSVADQIFGADGHIAKLLPNYEVRLPQLYMARLVQRAIEMREPAVVEAGTGTGKSYAYAAVCMALGKKVIISTSNKALQMQLIEKDLPFLQRIWPGKKVAVSVGKGNYACRLKCEPLSAVMQNHDDLARWFCTTATGNTEEIDFAIDGRALKSIAVDDECTGKHCPLYAECFYYRARAALQNADVVVTNHALLCLASDPSFGCLKKNF
jgi:ATP-dependent DNA helicase DinG